MAFHHTLQRPTRPSTKAPYFSDLISSSLHSFYSSHTAFLVFPQTYQAYFHLRASCLLFFLPQMLFSKIARSHLLSPNSAQILLSQWVFLNHAVWSWSSQRVDFFVYFGRGAHLKHVEIPRPGIKPLPQQWQHQILNMLGPQGTPFLCISSYLIACHILLPKFFIVSPSIRI